MKDIVICIGTSGELIKMAPIIRELQKRNIDYYFINTGQHNLNPLIEQLEVKKPDKEFNFIKNGHRRGRFNSLIGALKWGFLDVAPILRKTIKELNPNVVLVHGDTMTTALSAIVVKSLKGVKLGHVEAGLRSFNIFEPFPEELMRLVTDKLSDLFFAPTQFAANNLKGKKNVYVTGNTNIDSLIFALKKIGNIEPIDKDEYLIAKIHRQENIKNKKRLLNFVEILHNINYKTYFIVMPNTQRELEKNNLIKKIKENDNIIIISELRYLEFIRYYRDAKAILTDGGGEIEEATYLKKPCLVYRHETERQEAELAGFAVRLNSDIDKALKYIDLAFNKKSEFYRKVKKSKCPYGDGTASKKIVDILMRL